MVHGTAGGGGQHPDHGAGRQRGRADSAERVGGPAAQHERNVDAAAEGHVTAHAGVRRAEGQGLRGQQGDGGIHRQHAVPAGGIRHRDRQNGPGDGEHLVGQGGQRQPAEGVFEHGGRGRVAYDPVGAPQGAAVECPRAGDALVGVAGTAEILHGRLGAGGEQADARGGGGGRGKGGGPGGFLGCRIRGDRRLRRRAWARSRILFRAVCRIRNLSTDDPSGGDLRAHRAEPHLVARPNQCRLRTLQVPEAGVGAAEQLPAAGGGAGVDGGVVAGHGHGAGRHRAARRTAPRHGQRGVRAGEVEEAGGEAAERGGPVLTGVRGDDAVDAQAGVRGDIGEVFPVVDDVDVHERGIGGRGRPHLQLP